MKEVHPPYDLITCFSAGLRPAGSVACKMWLAYALHRCIFHLDGDLGYIRRASLAGILELFCLRIWFMWLLGFVEVVFELVQD